jgi:diguanylate cyclase
MRQGIVRKGLLIVVMATGLVAPAMAADVGQLLREAESLRSRDPSAFAKALGKLEAVEEQATSPQKQQLRLLRAYQMLAAGKYDKAIQDALALFNESQDAEFKFRAALLVANGAAITRDFSLGLRYLETALSLSDQIADLELRHRSYLVAAILYNQYGQFTLGQHYSERLLGQETSPRTLCMARQLRAEAILGLGVSQIDERELGDATSHCAAQNEPIPANQLRGYLARHLSAQGKNDEAVELLESSLPEVEATKYPWLIGEIHSLLAQYHLAKGRLTEAKTHAQHALDRGDKNAYLTPIVAAHRVLYEVAMKNGDLRTALKEYRLYAEADKARLDEVKAREFAFQLSRHELQQKNQSIELLQRQNEVLRLQQEISKKSAINNRLFVAMLLMVLGVGAYWAYKIKRVQVMFRRQAQVDSLTGVSNRRHFREQAEAQLVRCKNGNREAALVLLDLDNFKRINDRYGHATGDWVLKQVATACQASCREGDLFGRLGGEEFAILTCGGDLHAAERIAQECRKQMAAIDTSQFDDEVPVITASYGCATTKLCGHDFENLFMHADRAMYRAKAEGRDRVCSHEERPVLVRTQQVTA